MGLKEFKLLKSNLLAVARIELKEISNMENKISLLEEEIAIEEGKVLWLNKGIESALSSSEIVQKEKEISDFQLEFEKVKKRFMSEDKKLTLKRASYFPIVMLTFGLFVLLMNTEDGLEMSKFEFLIMQITVWGGCYFAIGFLALVVFSPTMGKRNGLKLWNEKKQKEYDKVQNTHNRKKRVLMSEIKDNKKLEGNKPKLAKTELLIQELKREHGELSNRIIESTAARDKLVAEVAHLIPFSSEIL